MIPKNVFPFRLILLLLAAVGFVLIYISTSKYGVGITSVSCEYIAAARSLADGRGLLLYDATPYLDYPPLLPVLLALAELLRIDSAEAIRFLNAISFAMIIFLSGTWLQRNISSRPFMLLGAAFTLFSLDVLNASIFAWPEAVFLLLITAFLFDMEKLLENGSRAPLWRAAILAALACSLRYIGITLAATAILCVFLGGRRELRRKIVDSLIIAAVAAAPLLIWVVRNYAVSGTIAGERGPSPYPFFDNLQVALSIVSGWLFTLRVGAALRIALMGLLFVILAWMFIRQRRMPPETAPGVFTQKMMPALIFIAIYTAAMVVLSSVVALDALNSRFIIPVFVPLTWVVVGLAENLRRLPRSPWLRRLFHGALIFYFLALVGWWGTVEMRWVAHYHREGAGGQSTEEWHNSEVINYLKNTPLSGTVYSNEPWALYMLAGVPANLAPRQHLFHSPAKTTDDLDKMRGLVAKGGEVYLVWVERFERPFLHPLAELKSTFDLEPVGQFQDGIVFRVK